MEGGAEAATLPLGRSKKNRIQVSAKKKPLYFYVNLAKRYIQNYNEVELSALGMAIGTVVTVAEILKNKGLANEIKISTSKVVNKHEAKGRWKAKIEILMGKSESCKDTTSKQISDDTTSTETSKPGVVTKDEDKGHQKSKTDIVTGKNVNSKNTTSSEVSISTVVIKDDAKCSLKAAKIDVVKGKTENSRDTTTHTEIFNSTATTESEAKTTHKDKNGTVRGQIINSNNTTSIEISTSTVVTEDEAKAYHTEANGHLTIGTEIGSANNSKDTTVTAKVVDDKAVENEIHI